MKRAAQAVEEEARSVAPSRERELKQAHSENHQGVMDVAPSRERELKQLSELARERQQRRSLTGA